MAGVAYSYIRFSTRKQADGESLRRQTELAVKYARKHGLKLDTTLNLQDLGVSAYDRSNALTGAFAGFMAAVDAGKVARGSYLLVEQFDRLSRAKPLVALRQLEMLISAGIRVVTLQDEKVYDEETADDLGNLFVSLAIMARAHEESASKSKRIGDAWEAKRSRKEAVMTTECPSWLKPRPDRSGFDIIEDKAESVRRIFEMTINGFGNSTIVRLANTQGWTHPGRATTWNQSIVSKIVRNRACIGEYQPKKINHESGKPEAEGEPWTNHYPSVVTDEKFVLANAAKSQRAKIPGRRDRLYKNLFQGILTCGGCGGSLVRKNKGGLKVQNSYFLYMCTRRVEFVTKCKSAGNVNFELNLLTNIYLYGYQQIRTEDEAQQLRNRTVILNSEMVEQKEIVEKTINLLMKFPSETLALAVQKAENRIADIKSELKELARELAQLKLADSNISAMLNTTFDKDYARIIDDSEVEFRAELREKILSTVRRIVAYPEKGVAIIFYRHTSEPGTQPLSDDFDFDELPALVEDAKRHLKDTD